MFPNNEGGKSHLQSLHDILHENKLGITWRLFGRQIGEVDHSSVVINLLEIAVLLDDTGILVVLKPVAATFLELCIELGIEFVVIDNAFVVDFLSIDTDETS